jgi:hypothetical protein
VGENAVEIYNWEHAAGFDGARTSRNEEFSANFGDFKWLPEAPL